jgi:nucleotide-binding universal stress UspA family protein
MHVLCAIGTQGGPELIRRMLEVIGPQHELHLLHIIDTGPRRTFDEYLHRPGPLHHPPPPPSHEAQIDEAEQEAGKAALEEASQAAERAGFHIQTDIQRGKPEQIIVQSAYSWQCELIAIQASEGTQGRPHIGPESVGHTARFVLDHAPCDVLLLRGMERPDEPKS